MNVEKSNQSTSEQSYEAVYKNETTGIQPLNTKRWLRNRREALIRASTPNIACHPHRMRLLFGYFPSTAAKKEGFAVRDGEMYDGGHLHYFTLNTLKQLYLMNQIRPIQMMGFGRFGWLHTIHLLLLSGSAFVIGKKQ